MPIATRPDKQVKNGAEAKTNVAKSRIFLRLMTSDSEAAGRLIKIPGMVEADAKCLQTGGCS